MVIGIIGENCAGKSTVAEGLRRVMDAEIVTGKDYLRLAKTETEAEKRFRDKLSSAMTGSHIIYVISEKEQAALLPEKAIKVLVTADLEQIKERFRVRMRGNLPQPVERMLERKHGMFDQGDYDFRFVSGKDELSAFCAQVKSAVDG